MCAHPSLSDSPVGHVLGGRRCARQPEILQSFGLVNMGKLSKQFNTFSTDYSRCHLSHDISRVLDNSSLCQTGTTDEDGPVEEVAGSLTDRGEEEESS